MNHIAYHFKVDPPQPGSEILIALIGDMGFESFTDTADGFVAYIDEKEEGKVELDALQFEDFKFEVRKERIAKQNWNEEWEKNFSPVEVDDQLLIRAPFHPNSTKHKIEIIIMPKMSFGTGHHQTTRLVCAQMLQMEWKGKRVLDMGCGTGILAILAVKLGADDVLGIDIDEWSVENSKENCAVNDCAKVKLMKGDIDLLEKESSFDVIIANINKNILRSQLPVYSQKLIAGGSVLLSGFFTTDVNELRDVAEKCGLQFVVSNNSEEWAMMVLEKLVRQ